MRIAIQHPMESGFRPDLFGRRIPKNVINNLVCRYNGVEVFRAEMGSGVAANPQLQFYTIARDSGELIKDAVQTSRGSNLRYSNYQREKLDDSFFNKESLP